MSDFEPIDADTHELILTWLNHDPSTPGTTALLKQLECGVTAVGNGTCGCGSLGLLVAADAPVNGVDYGLHPVEGDVLNPAGEVIGGLMLWM